MVKKYLSDLRILVEDDTPLMCDLLVSLLNLEGFEKVFCSTDPEQGLEFAQQSMDLVLLDFKMPKLNGIEFMQRFKQRYRLTESSVIPKFVMVTTENHTEIIRRAIEEGVEGYMLKPFSSQVLKQKIMELFPEHIDHSHEPSFVFI